MDLQNASKEELIKEIKRISGLNSEYNDEISRLKQLITEVNSKLEEADALKSHFISNICNELVNPFTSVLTLANSILEIDKENWKKVISMIALIHSEVSHLDFQLKNIFAAAKLEAGELIPETSTVDISNLVSNVIDSFKYDTRHKKLSIEFIQNNINANTKIFFNTDSEKLHLIISNLLSNAIKFSYPDSKIILRIKRSLDELILEVEDFGQGISTENAKIIFDRFKRVDSGINSLNRGHGLGLSVNKAILDVLDGTISFKTEINKGTTFTVSISESKEESTGISSDANELFFKEEKF